MRVPTEFERRFRLNWNLSVCLNSSMKANKWNLIMPSEVDFPPDCHNSINEYSKGVKGQNNSNGKPIASSLDLKIIIDQTKWYHGPVRIIRIYFRCRCKKYCLQWRLVMQSRRNTFRVVKHQEKSFDQKYPFLIHKYIKSLVGKIKTNKTDTAELLIKVNGN